jgi:hypothetical protein
MVQKPVIVGWPSPMNVNQGLAIPIWVIKELASEERLSITIPSSFSRLAADKA